MPTLTDPARELADVCSRLSTSSTRRGDEHLAGAFQVPPWSKEFYQIVFCIVERADYLIGIVDSLELDEDFRQEATSHITQVKEAFGLTSLMNQWNAIGGKHLAAQNVQPIKMLSGTVRQKVSYPKLSEDELKELSTNWIH